jgi:hypothetical protein
MKRKPTTRFITYGFSADSEPKSDPFTPILRDGGIISFDFAALSSPESSAMLHATKLFVDHCAALPFSNWQIVLHSQTIERLKDRGDER